VLVRSGLLVEDGEIQLTEPRGIADQLNRSNLAAGDRESERAEEAPARCDRTDPVTDEIWNEAAKHYDERQLAGSVLAIATINVWNRLNVATRQVAGEWMKSPEVRKLVETAAAR